MANMNTFLLLLLSIYSISFVNGRIRSNRYLKPKFGPYAFPMDVCSPKTMAGQVTSMRLRCEDERARSSDDTPERNVVAYHYRNDNCSGSARYIDTFRPSHRPDYPFSCWEPEEELGAVEMSAADHAARYAQNYMIIKMSFGKKINVTIPAMNATNTTNATAEYVEEQCIKHPTRTFYKTFPAITNKCVLGWIRDKTTNIDTPYWYYAACTPNSTYLERWDGYNCTGNQTGAFPIYNKNGCNEREWLGQSYYMEVLNCSHPDYTRGVGFRNNDNNIISIIFICIVALWNIR